MVEEQQDFLSQNVYTKNTPEIFLWGAKDSQIIPAELEAAVN
jgi:hypothetical protein